MFNQCRCRWCLFPRVRGFWENVRQFIPRLCSLLFLILFFLVLFVCVCVCVCFKVEISFHTLIPLYRPGLVHSGSASLDDCDRMFPDELRVRSFPDRILTLCVDSNIVSPLRDFVGSRVYACLDVTCHLHFWQNDRDLLRATAVTRG